MRDVVKDVFGEALVARLDAAERKVLRRRLPLVAHP
jgi:hypothetical protein